MQEHDGFACSCVLLLLLSFLLLPGAAAPDFTAPAPINDCLSPPKTRFDPLEMVY